MSIKKTSLVIHHSAIHSDDDKEQFDLIDNAHERRWNGRTKSRMGFFGGYGYIVERSGVVQQFRNDDETGAHCNKGMKWTIGGRVSANYYAIGICFAGNMSEEDLTPEQIESGYTLIRDLQNKHNIPESEVRPHRYYTPTQCPGNRIPNDVMGYLRDEYEKGKGKVYDVPAWSLEGVKWAHKNKIINRFSGREIKDYELATILHRLHGDK